MLLDKTEFEKIQKQLNSLHFDKFIEFLKNANYKPVINELEIFLTQALSEFGVNQTICDVGNSLDQSSLQTIKANLPNSFSKNNQLWTVVGADSVRSTISGMLGNDKGRITVRLKNRCVDTLKVRN